MSDKRFSPKALLFDYGGTLDTSARHWYYVIREAYSDAGFDLPDAVLREAYVYGERYLAAHPIIRPEDEFYILLYKKMEAEFDYLTENGHLHFYRLAERQRVAERLAAYCDEYAACNIDRSRKVIAQLAEKYRLVLVSNFYGNLHSVLDGYGLSSFFPTIVESAVVGVRKPDPRIWTLGVEAAGCRPEEAFAIGDSYGKDIVSATKAGCRTVWFKGETWKAEEADESLPTRTITAIEQLLDVFE